jgi:hypothetical protein
MGIAYNTSVIKDSLVLHLDAANPKSYPGTGTVWTDISGQGNNGTLVNGVGYSSDDEGSLVFDSINDYAYAFLPQNVPVTNPYTFEVWAYWPKDGIWDNGTGIRHEILMIGSNAGNIISSSNPFIGIAVQDVVSDTIAFFSWTDNFFATYTLPERNAWYHIVATSQTGTDQVKMYVNGDLKNTGTLTQTGTTTYPGISIGAGYFGYGDKSISIARLYERVLTETEVKQNFEAHRGRYDI